MKYITFFFLFILATGVLGQKKQFNREIEIPSKTPLANGGLTNLILSNETSSTSLTGDLRKVTLPLLVLTGKYDFVVPPALAHDLHNLSSSLEKKIVVLEKSGHSPMIHEPIKYRNEIISFIEANK